MNNVNIVSLFYRNSGVQNKITGREGRKRNGKVTKSNLHHPHRGFYENASHRMPEKKNYRTIVINFVFESTISSNARTEHLLNRWRNCGSNFFFSISKCNLLNLKLLCISKVLQHPCLTQMYICANIHYRYMTASK